MGAEPVIRWASSEYIYPDPFDSTKREVNPDYHPPIFYGGGKFTTGMGDEIPKKDVPQYILDQVKDVPKARKKHEHADVDMKDIMTGKRLVDTGDKLTEDIKKPKARRSRKK